ncbi:F-box and WD repeat domain containing protein 10B-like [Saccostrea cucullata]|uniref:F-box and WD repeat domain containing protein 10B-like n=1 Tax=Saccostrea cuccullata TaxID=36930 RepID=UPI002ED2D079
MLEVCNYSQGMDTLSNPVNNNSMKHPSANLEVFEFNIGKAQSLRCASSATAISCGECETCLLSDRMKNAKEFFPKLGSHSKKRFMLGLMRRFHSVDLLHQMVSLLQPLSCKDFTYSRSRAAPSLDTDMTTFSSDRAMDLMEVEQFITGTWMWFQKANYWTKANFALSLLQLCEISLLHTLSSQARTLLISEEKATTVTPEEDYVETASIPESEYSFHSEEHADLQVLSIVSPHYGKPKLHPITGDKLLLDDVIENDDSGTDSESELSSVDPACMVIPTSSKAFSGVARHKDFIRSLPVHLAKYILKLLDKTSLSHALLVSQNWRALVLEVHDEERINQLLEEDVMLMQGAAAQGVNHQYAKDIDVPVPNLFPGTRTVKLTDDEVISPTYLQEVNFTNAYSGVSTRNVIMEERNVYCGTYNVMVLSMVEDHHRVIHTDGGQNIAIGSKDRKIRFIDRDSGNELPLVISGHAGSIRCVHICTERGIVLSGSYDTSIRMWSVETGTCKKIFRGHRDTILTILVLDDYLASGSKDNSCKIWNMQTGKCQRTFKHKAPVWAVAVSQELCITGCEQGKVKVWDIKSGDLIKVLARHHAQITSIKFDRWHIITGSKDGYALVWSSQGEHARCLNALRHPKPVLCLEFQYLRVITGSADGRLRIWNMISGQCCRIMRGNSASDPIQSIIAIDDRITLNTSKNLIELRFESVTWDYTLENDKIPSAVKYSSYSDAPIRPQPYPYIRAQRMKRAGASNTKIIHHDPKKREIRPPNILQMNLYAKQIPHSAKCLSQKSLESARFIQSAAPESGYESGPSPPALDHRPSSDKQTVSSNKSFPTKPLTSKPPRPSTFKSATSIQSVVIADPLCKHYDDDDDDDVHAPVLMKRRVSWAFDQSIFPKTKDISLSETKALLRSQMRMKAESVVPPDFIYLTVNAIQNSMQSSETTNNTKKNIRAMVSGLDGFKRPSSSPSKIDPRTKVPVDELGLEKFHPKSVEAESLSEFSDTKSFKSLKSSKAKESDQAPGPNRERYATPCEIKPTKTKIRMSLHPKKVKTTVPVGRSIRPVSAAAHRQDAVEVDMTGRPVTAPTIRRPDTAISDVPSTIASALPGVVPQHKKQPAGISSSMHDVNLVPMKMYPKDMKEKLSALIQEKRRAKSETVLRSASDTAIGKVSQYNDPMRSHVKFELRTYEQEKEFINNIEQMYIEKQQNDEEMLEKKKRAAWLAKASSRPSTVYPSQRSGGAPGSAAVRPNTVHGSKPNR